MSELPRTRDLLTEKEIQHFPILFGLISDYRSADRMAGIWEAIGLDVIIRPLGNEYVLILNLPPD